MKIGNEQAILLFRQTLLAWFRVNGRTFPWRREHDPFRILIAERMLHRTRADQVVPVYHHFLSRYPTVDAQAAADPEEVHNFLAPLGLAWRFDTFVPMARYLVAHHGGAVPDTLQALRRLPGVGTYTAEAVLCFAFGQRNAVVDTNTIRVAGRYLIGKAWTADDRKRVAVRASVNSLVDPEQAAASNHAMLDLGAMICVVKSPLCHRCPVAAGCAYHSVSEAPTLSRLPSDSEGFQNQQTDGGIAS